MKPAIFPLPLAMAMLTSAAFAQTMYVGTYTDANTKGIYAYHFDAKSGKLTPLGLMAETPSPSFLAWHPSGKFMYAVNETGKNGTVTSFGVDSHTGKLTQLNQVSSKGADPCHIAVDHTGKAVMVANYSSGSVVSYPILPDGKIGEVASFLQHHGSGVNKERQEAPHAHSVNIPANNKFVLAADLGLDKIFTYVLDPATAKLTAGQPPFTMVEPGSGPRHMAFAPDQKHAYSINEIASTVTAFNYDAATGALKEIQNVSTLPADFHGESTTAEVFIDHKGKFLYGSNRGLDSIAVFAISADGSLKLIQNMKTGGAMPRNFALDPSGKFLLAANQKGNNIVVFRIDAATGKLSETGNHVELGAPVCLLFKTK